MTKLNIAKAQLTAREPAPLKALDAFKADAERVYEKTRDEGKMMAVLEITAALADAYSDGARDVLKQQLAKYESGATGETE